MNTNVSPIPTKPPTTAQAQLRLGIFGGTFDPPHQVHLALAQAAINGLQLDRLLIVPSGKPWQREAVATGTQRLVMAELAFSGIAKVKIDASELERAARTQQASYTIDTVKHVLAAHHKQLPRAPQPKLFLVIGSDQAQRFCTWHQWQDLLQLCQLAVAVRGTKATLNLPNNLTDFLADQRMSMSVIPMPASDQSATAIRCALVTGADATTVPGLPTPVAQYIQAQRLYRHG